METRGQIEEPVGVGDERAVALGRESRSSRDGGERQVEATGGEEPGGAGERGVEKGSAGPAHGPRRMAPLCATTQTATGTRARRRSLAGTSAVRPSPQYTEPGSSRRRRHHPQPPAQEL